ncbi:VanW family protein [Desulforamulus ferrireducens]|uniref:Copper amine oxidase-like N-terminal domain-containing protein n=1 Tax=Desulforamulus ferrireducens TaxID=1833852 RepID=A0A1S6IUB2_9FIRM|nr:VanW family protein [Desulforamulus ferrireducens]AQS58365.1 hypothetical protein B0537_04205 [Desulforamulus ferrireducens]
MVKKTALILLLFLCLAFSPMAYASQNSFIKVAECKLPLPSDEIPGAIHNVTHSAQLVNEVILQPGEIFSYNQVVGPRTLERGFVWSKSIGWRGGKYVWIDDVGGGVCRTSTAIHQAVKKADLKVIERHDHSLPVDYVAKGEDAAVWYGTWDYKFQNVKKVPIKLKSFVENNELSVVIEAVNPYAITVDNIPVELNAIPYIDNGKFMIPLRVIAKSMGGEIVWKENSPIYLETEHTQTILNDLKEINGITFIKATTLAQLMGYQVTWHEDTKTLSFSKPIEQDEKEIDIAQATENEIKEEEMS